MEFQTMMMQFLAATLGKSNEEITAILFKKGNDGAFTDEMNDDAFETLENLHSEHLKAAPADLLKAEYDKGHNAGKFEALSKEEEFLKKTYGLEGKGKMRDLIAEAIGKAQKDGNSEDKILTSPLYVSKVAELQEQIEQIKEQSAKEIQAATTRVERQMRFTNVLPTFDSALEAAGVNLQGVRPNAKKAFLDQYRDKDFEFAETGTYIKGEDGNLLKDKHGHPIKLEAHVAQEAANWFEIQKQPGRQSPGNDPTNPPKPAGAWTPEKVKGMKIEAFKAQYDQIQDPAERNDFMSAFEAANNPNAPQAAST